MTLRQAEVCRSGVRLISVRTHFLSYGGRWHAVQPVTFQSSANWSFGGRWTFAVIKLVSWPLTFSHVVCLYSHQNVRNYVCVMAWKFNDRLQRLSSPPVYSALTGGRSEYSSSWWDQSRRQEGKSEKGRTSDTCSESDYLSCVVAYEIAVWWQSPRVTCKAADKKLLYVRRYCSSRLRRRTFIHSSETKTVLAKPQICLLLCESHGTVMRQSFDVVYNGRTPNFCRRP